MRSKVAGEERERKKKRRNRNKNREKKGETRKRCEGAREKA